MRGGRRRRGSRKPKSVWLGPPETIEIETLGRQGDGEGRLGNGKRVFVANTLPGERVHVKPVSVRGDGIAADLLEVVSEVPRQAPICAVFDQCGGCQVQHVPTAEYAAWKSNIVANALIRQGIEVAVGPLRTVPTQSRRRATLSAVKTVDGVVLGFHRAFSSQVVNIASCPLLLEPLNGLLTPLREALAAVLDAGEKMDVEIGLIGGHIDVGLIGAIDLDLGQREALSAFASACGVARLYARDGHADAEPILVREDVTLSLGSATVPVPPGSFLQPSDEGEELLQSLVQEGIENAKNIADLYCGLGTFSLPLASKGNHVTAIDGAKGAIAALDLAAGRANLGGRLQTVVRDLKRAPMSVSELREVDAVIFDPPRAGAKEQAAIIAESDIPRVVAVSCNPATLGRDLRLLIDGGYAIDQVTPVDQFPMSYHVEVVVVLHKTH